MKRRMSVVVASVLVLGAGGCSGDNHTSTVTSEPAVTAATFEPAATTDLAQRFATAGHAALRYEPPGVGRSGGAP